MYLPSSYSSYTSSIAPFKASPLWSSSSSTPPYNSLSPVLASKIMKLMAKMMSSLLITYFLSQHIQIILVLKWPHIIDLLRPLSSLNNLINSNSLLALKIPIFLSNISALKALITFSNLLALTDPSALSSHLILHLNLMIKALLFFKTLWALSLLLIHNFPQEEILWISKVHIP